MNMNKMVTKVACALALVASSSVASAAVMTFDGLTENMINQATYVENGITATSTSGNNFWGFPSGGQLHLDPDNFNNASYDFTFGGNGFKINSVDVSYDTFGAIGTWTGFDAANNLIATYVMSADTLKTDTAFAGFDNVFRVSLVNTVSHFSLDNLNISAARVDTDVPEPFSLALLGIGLAGLAVSRRKKQ